MTATGRIQLLETKLGAQLPADYRRFLSDHNATSGGIERAVLTNPDYWDVQHLFEVGTGPAYVQLDEVYELVGDVLPVGTVPIGQDSGGNFYLLDCLVRPGIVSWWNHEREIGDNEVDRVASSFSEFLSLLEPQPN